jgi:hypothetical protein
MLQDDLSEKLPGLFDQSTMVPGCLPALDANGMVARMDEATKAWHGSAEPAAADAVLILHRANFDLWHLEDSARDPHAAAELIAEVKRAIDRTNQRRNDCVESIDVAMLEELGARALPLADAPLHSETPGQMVDRLSILSLKRFHMGEEAVRATANEAHQSRSRDRLHLLHTQSADLAGCLSVLWDDVLAGRRRFKLYKQMKMYNDVDSNPVLYTAEPHAAAAGHGHSTGACDVRVLDPAESLAYKR